MPTVNTVRILHEEIESGILINESDFDKNEHVRFDDKPKTKTLSLPSKD